MVDGLRDEQTAAARELTALRRQVAELEQQVRGAQQQLTALQGQLARHDQFLGAVPAVLWEASAQTLRFTYVNEQGVALLGLPRERWLQDPDFLTRSLHVEEREAVLACIGDLLARRTERCSLVHRMVTEDGRVIWVDSEIRAVFEDGRPTRLRGAVVEITQRQQERLALETRSARLAEAFRASLDGLFLLDLDGHYLEVNPAGCEMFGYSREELLAADIGVLAFPEEMEQQQARKRLLWRNGGFVPLARLRHRDGREVWVEMSLAPVKVNGAMLVLASKREVTEQRHARDQKDQMLLALHQELRELKRRPTLTARCDGCGRLADDRGGWHSATQWLELQLPAASPDGPNARRCPDCARTEPAGPWPDLFTRPDPAAACRSLSPPEAARALTIPPPPQPGRRTSSERAVVSRQPACATGELPRPQAPAPEPPPAAPAPPTSRRQTPWE